MTGASHDATSKFSQILADVIVNHTPWSAKANETVKAEFRKAFLEELESHSAELIGPFVKSLQDTGEVPAEFAPLLDAVANPTQQVGSIVQQFLIFGIGFAVASQIAQPFLQALSNTLWADNTYKPLDPSQLAIMAVRGIDPNTTSITPVSDVVKAIAAESGLSPQYMQALVDATGMPPSPQDLFQMFRRAIIDQDELATGLKEGDTRDEWIPNFIKLAYTTPTPIDMVRAAVQNQLDYDTANQIAITLGLEPPGYVGDNPDWFSLLYHIAGRPPGPEELGRAANRNIIPWSGTGEDVTSFEQGISESDIKDKWTSVLQALQVYVPPPRMVGGLLKSASITAEQAETYWEMSGVPQQLAQAYVHQATTELTEQEKALTKGSVLSALYDGIIDQPTAVSLLGVLGFVGQTATYMIELTLMRREIRAIDRAVSKIGSLYNSFKITNVDAKSSLEALGVPDDQITELLNVWATERAPETRLPSVGALGKAVKYSGLPFDLAVSKAMLLGYTKYDATVEIASSAELPPPNGWPPLDDTGVQV